jgi:hypothetical protein
MCISPTDPPGNPTSGVLLGKIITEAIRLENTMQTNQTLSSQTREFITAMETYTALSSELLGPTFSGLRREFCWALQEVFEQLAPHDLDPNVITWEEKSVYSVRFLKYYFPAFGKMEI